MVFEYLAPSDQLFSEEAWNNGGIHGWGAYGVGLEWTPCLPDLKIVEVKAALPTVLDDSRIPVFPLAGKHLVYGVLL